MRTEAEKRDRLGQLNYECTVNSFAMSGLVEKSQVVRWKDLEEEVREGHREGAEMVKQEVLREMAREMVKINVVQQIEKEN